MNKDLERRIEERKQEAVEKNIHAKADKIGVFLGMNITQTAESETHSVYEFYRQPFDIEIIGLSASISYNRKLVYESSSPDKKGISRYVPGEWLEEFEALYLEAEETKRMRIGEAVRKVADEEAQKEQELKKRFGLE